MIVIVGESACGKSSVAEYLVNNCGYKKIITYTTRQPRKGELDGVDYHFVDDDLFKSLEHDWFFAETATYNGWHYGSAKDDYSDDKVVILTPRGLRAIRKSGVQNIFSVYISVPRRDRLINCLKRGDNIEEAYRRNLSDLGQFDGISDEVDLVIENPQYACSVEAIANAIVLEELIRRK